ncbi:hypothetical protein LOC68_08840 [Blastopirellula sp. JC732]|uniref:Restriction endonuclease type IV Mrr domain-containing protein n=1 Tax=Blastopirellula sediminis TaxID=2894196 RepID=A0A9X1MLM6_9BACT|nr:hypothetical protein [Blastopirellula sediminis]MCC9608723.1 hypothetical protein [Blastopirellula sediminis]MCC9628500.1 hypothetical protein [Blastopirellula sediminis]
MPPTLPPHFVELLYDALLKSYWRKKALRNFLRRSHISENFLAGCSDDETKRDWLDRLFPILERSDRGQRLLQQIAWSLAEQDSFPDLSNWEDSAEKIRDAKKAVAALKEYLERKEEERRNDAEIIRRRHDAEQRKQKALSSASTFESLKQRLDSLCSGLGTQQAGYDFQDWFYDLMNFFDIDNRRPYVVDGRQIDGSITLDGTTYLVELKFTSSQADATAIDSLLKKVNDKADNTMGVIVSMSGYSSVAMREASFSRSPLLLFDASHLYFVLNGVESFPDVLRRVRRHSSQEGASYLRVSDFGK